MLALRPEHQPVSLQARYLLLAIVVSAALVAGNWNRFAVSAAGRPWTSMPDAEGYVSIAQGHIEQVHKPFSNRFLHPTFARMIANATGMRIDQAFLLIAVVVVTLFASVVAAILNQTTHSFVLTAALLCTPFLNDVLMLIYLPDLIHAAVTGLFFLLLLRGSYRTSLLVLLMLVLIRESTVLLSMIVVLVSLRSKKGFALQVIGVTVVGLVITSFVTRRALPNIHGMSEGMYMLLKIPFNFAKNICGAVFVSDTLARLRPTSEPAVTLHLPSWLPLGQLHKAGFSGFSATGPLTTLSTWLTQFGIAPTLVTIEMIRKRRPTLSHTPAWMFIALIYGLFSFYIGPCLGAAVVRLVGYGWPAFLLAAPALLIGRYRIDKRTGVTLLVLQVLTCLLPIFEQIWGDDNRVLLTVIALAIPLQLAAIMIYRKLPPLGSMESGDAPRPQSATSSSSGKSAPAPT